MAEINVNTGGYVYYVFVVLFCSAISCVFIWGAYNCIKCTHQMYHTCTSRINNTNTQESPSSTQSKPPKPSYPKPINISKNRIIQGATTPTLPSVDTNFRTVNPMYKYNV